MQHPTLFTTPTLALPNSISWSSLRRHFFVGTLAVTLFAIPRAALAVMPPPDGDYANHNTAEGGNALFSLTTGFGNTASGKNALDSNTTGQNNTAIGADVLNANVNGNDNTAAGFAALARLGFDGIDNTAIGSGALFSQTSGGLQHGDRF
jgi:hypothetical protein